MDFTARVLINDAQTRVANSNQFKAMSIMAVNSKLCRTVTLKPALSITNTYFPETSLQPLPCASGLASPLDASRIQLIEAQNVKTN